MQQTARKNEWPLDRMTISCDVTKKSKEDFGSPPREGAYVYGLFMEGARWDTQSGLLSEARLKELTPSMPVCYLKGMLFRGRGRFWKSKTGVRNWVAKKINGDNMIIKIVRDFSNLFYGLFIFLYIIYILV